jgi:transmembrane sensor
VVVGTMAGRVLRTGATVLTGTGQLAVVNMAGGGQLRLNGNTSIRLTGLRQIGMHRGQIYVDAGGPGLDDLAVTTPVGVLRDVGTRFDVLMEGTSVRVRVRDGVVRLTAGGIVTDASAGQQLLAEPGAPVVVGVGTTYGPDWDWILRAAPFQADGAQLEAFLRWVEIEGGLTVDFADPTLRQRAGQTVLHGSIENLGLEDALDVILPASGLTHRTVGGRIVITGAGSSR